MSFTEVHGDLFTSSDSLVHCVSRDLHMGKGIATEFKKQFGGLDDLRQQNVGIGEVGVLRHGDRYIYYLVTKDRYFQKPTLDNLRRSLESAQHHCQQHGVTRLAMPRIGCGLDKLNWTDVSQLLCEIFVNSGISVTVFSL